MEDMSQLQMEAILNPDSQEPFLMFISDLLNDEKKWEAQSMGKLITDKDPESFALKLAHYLADPISRHDNNVVTGEACAHILRELFIGSEGEEGVLNRLSVSAIKCILLDCMKLEESKDIMEEFCYTVSMLAISDNNDNWPQLFPFLFQSLTHPTPNILLKGAIFKIFALLAIHNGKTMVHCAEPLHPIFLTTLNNYTLDLDLRIEATRAVINFILFVPVSSNGKHKFQELLPV